MASLFYVHDEWLAPGFSFRISFPYEKLSFECSGYVSKVRKKYWKICCPFYLEVDRNESEEHTSFLPPLDAPKFRWWHCQNCLREFAAKDCGTLFNCCSTQCGSSSGCLHVGSAAVFLPGFKKTPKPVLSETSADANTSSKLNNDNRLLFCNDKKENNVEVAQNTLIGTLQSILFYYTPVGVWLIFYVLSRPA